MIRWLNSLPAWLQDVIGLAGAALGIAAFLGFAVALGAT